MISYIRVTRFHHFFMMNRDLLRQHLTAMPQILGIAPEIPMMTDVIFENRDQEYLESVVLDDILSMIKLGYHGK